MTIRPFAFALCLAVSSAQAQQSGFFRPAPDVSLTRPPAPAQPAAQPRTQPAQQTQQAGGNPVAAPEVALEQPAQPSPAAVLRWSEEQMDRSAMENERARAQAATSTPAINGAFDATTDERNR